MKINWKLIIVLLLAVAALMITAIGLRKYHRIERAQTGLTKGLAAYEAEQWNDAAVYLGRYLSINQQDIEILIKYAQSQIRSKPFKRGNLAQAVNAYRAVLRNEANVQAAAEIVEIYLQVGMPAEAELVARDFVENDENGQFRQMLSSSLIQQRKFEEAIDILSELIRQKPDQLLAFKLLGEIAEKQTGVNDVSVQQWFDKAIEENPTSAQAHILRSAYLIKIGNVAEATRDLEIAEKYDLSDVGVRLSLAAGWLNLGSFDKVQRHLEVVRTTAPSNQGLWRVWAMHAVKTGNLDEMVWVAENGLSSLSSDNDAFLPVAVELFVQTDKLSRAEECIVKLKEAQVDRNIILYLEGYVSQAKMDWAAAIQKWQQAIYLGYASESVYLRLSQIYEQIENRPLAIQTLRRYIRQNGGTFQACLELSKLYANQGYWIEAEEQALASMRADSAAIEARLWYLRCRIARIRDSQTTEIVRLKKDIQQQVAEGHSVDGHALMFRLALKLEDYTLAGENLEQIEQKIGSGQQVVLKRAELFAAQGKNDQAIAVLEQANQAYPESDEIKQALVWNYTKTNQPEKSRQVVLAVRQKASNTLDCRRYDLWLAELALLEGKTNQAIEVYNALAQENEGDIFVKRQLLTLQFDNVDDKQLQKWVNDIKQVEGDDGWQWKYEQARLWYNGENFQAKYTQIVELLNANLILNPDNQASRILLASCHERGGNIQLALSLYRDALVGMPSNMDLIVAAVGTMYRAGEYDQAQKLLNDMTQRGIWDERLSKYELQNNLRMGRQEDVKAVLEKMIENAPEDADARLSLALLSIRRGEYEDAKKQIDALSKSHPDSVAVVAAMADLYFNQKQPENAMQVCNDYLADHDTLEAHIMQSQISLMAGKMPELAESLKTLERRFGDNGKAMIFAAKLHQETGSSEKALTIIEHLLSTKSGEDFVVQKESALMLLEQKSSQLYQKGQQCLEDALEKNPSDLQLRLKKAEVLIKEKNSISFDKARVILTKIVHEYPTLDSAWVALTQISLLEDNLGQSMDYLMQGLSQLPNSKLLLQTKAQIESIRSPVLSLGTLEELYDQYPQDMGILVMLSENYRKAGNANKAWELLQKHFADQTVKQSTEIQWEQIAVLWDLGQKENAERLYEELIRHTDDPSVFLSRLELAKNISLKEFRRLYLQWKESHPQTPPEVLQPMVDLIIKTKQPDAFNIATQMADDFLKQYPDSASLYFIKAMLLHQMGDKEQAIPWYEKTLELDSDHAIAINNLAWILCMERKDYKKSLQLANRGLTILPEYVDLIDTRGVIYMNMGKYEEAVKDFERCSVMYFKNNPRQTVSVFLLGKCFYLLDKKDRAFIELTTAQRQDLLTGGLSKEQADDLETLLKKL